MGDTGPNSSAGFDLLGAWEDDTPELNRRAVGIAVMSTSAGLPRRTSAGSMARCLGYWLAQTTKLQDPRADRSLR